MPETQHQDLPIGRWADGTKLNIQDKRWLDCYGDILFDSIYDIWSLCNLNLGTIYLVLQWIVIVFRLMYTCDDILSSVLVYHTCNVCRQLPADAG